MTTVESHGSIAAQSVRLEKFRKYLLGFYDRVQPVLVPGLRNSQFAYRDLLESVVTQQVRWLDIGCGRRLLPDWMPGSEETQSRIIGSARAAFGIDPDFASLKDNRALDLRVAGDSSRLPFADCSFDLLTANMVIEHISDPDALLREARRILKPGGIFVFHTPNSRSYATFFSALVPESWKKRLIGFLEGRKEKDVFPTFYRMNAASRIRAIAERNGLRTAELHMTESSAQAVMLGPAVILELLWIRILRISLFRGWRSNIIAVLQRDK